MLNTNNEAREKKNGFDRMLSEFEQFEFEEEKNHLKRNFLITMMASALVALGFFALFTLARSNMYWGGGGWGFGVQPPDAWIKSREEESGTSFVVQFTDQKVGTLIVGAYWFSQGISLEDYKQQIGGPALQSLPNFTKISERTCEVAGVSAWEVVCTYTSDNTTGKIKQVALVKERFGYVIYCGTTVELYEQYDPTFEEFIQNFKLIF